MLWVGNYTGGVDRWDRYNAKFTRSSSRPGLPGSFGDFVRSFVIDRNGDLWIGTFRLGVFKLDKKSGKLIHYMPEKNNPASLKGVGVMAILEDSRQNIWIGTIGGGVNLYNRKNNNFSHIKMVGKSNVIIDFAKCMD